MSTENTSKKRARSEDNPIITEDIITEDIVTEDIIEGGSKLRSWVYNWGERVSHPTDSKKYIFVCNQKLESGENCNTKIETSGPTGNIISHLGRRHKIYEHSKPPSSTPSMKQVKINNYTISSDSISQMIPDRQKYLETLLFEWLVLDFQPLYLLKSPSFRRFINALNENFELPNDKKFRKRIFDAYEFSQKQLKQYIHENSSSVSLTCDLWTSRSKQGFLGVTCHLITPDFEMKEITLAIRYMPYPHTGDAIQKELEKIISEWELQDKVFFCTTDNAASMKKCLNQISWLQRLSCTAHTIQLVVGKGLLAAEVLIARAKRLINFFTSPKQNERLLDAQKKNSEDPEEEGDLHTIFYRAITDVETRWSSTFIAWERLIILKPYIDIVISSLNVSKDRNAKDDAKRLMKINLTDDEWNTIRDLLEILGPFAELTEKLEGTKYATMSYIYPGIARLKKRFRPTIEFNNNNLDLETNDDAFEDHQFEEVDEDDEPEARRKIKINTPVNTSDLLNNIKVNLYKALEKYYEIIEKEALVATLLDPRKKKMKFADENEKEFAKNSLYEVYELAKNDTNIQQELHKPKPKKRKLSKGYVYKESLFSDDEYDDTQTEDNEIERYLVMTQIQSDQDPLKWWDVNKVQYPILAHMAQKYLSIQATSGASERVFSDTGLIMSAKRTRMKEDLFEALIFLKRNSNLVGGMFNNDT
ncbi:zinc finger BED domain-containing protein 4-like [Rhizophagus clarus]|uniref:Zinc finger BED domain-containing protein 4-like n=1 Tax=Rhizophagus clarus TaxID=94130 RepID=A0A8H3LDF4_9GLOM|nr:zinc finger BED domain-containing protein 4-like [Rhizophagus clarus]